MTSIIMILKWTINVSVNILFKSSPFHIYRIYNTESIIQTSIGSKDTKKQSGKEVSEVAANTYWIEVDQLSIQCNSTQLN